PVDEGAVQAGRSLGRQPGPGRGTRRARPGRRQGPVPRCLRRGAGGPRRRRRPRPQTPDAVRMRSHYCGALRAADAGTEVARCGWVAARREHGEHLAFVDLRDHTGVVQCVVDGAQDLRNEYVLRITGTVRIRPEGTANANLPTGEIEIGDCQVEVLNVAEPPPFPL